MAETVKVWDGTQWIDLQGPQGEPGPQGPRGLMGPQGIPGQSVRILGELPSPADLPPVGDPGDAWLINDDLWVWDDLNSKWTDIGRIVGPAGPAGPKGDPGDQGEPGPVGPANSLAIGTVVKGADAGATITGTPPSQTLSLTLPQGDPGPAATIKVGTVTTLPAGAQATVTNSGTTADATFDFGIPKGADGAGDIIPIGSIFPFAGAAAPDGWLMCDGSDYDSGTYPKLFAAIGSTFGTKVPDMRMRFPFGASPNAVSPDLIPGSWTTPSTWVSAGFGYAFPGPSFTTVGGGMRLTWNSSPTQSPEAGQLGGIVIPGSSLQVGKAYELRVRVRVPAGSSPVRACVGFRSSGMFSTEIDKEVMIDASFICTENTDIIVGVESMPGVKSGSCDVLGIEFRQTLNVGSEGGRTAISQVVAHGHTVTGSVAVNATGSAVAAPDHQHGNDGQGFRDYLRHSHEIPPHKHLVLSFSTGLEQVPHSHTIPTNNPGNYVKTGGGGGYSPGPQNTSLSTDSTSGGVHSHNIPEHQSTETAIPVKTVPDWWTGALPPVPNTFSGGGHGHSVSITASGSLSNASAASTGSATVDVLNPFIALNYIIKAA